MKRSRSRSHSPVSPSDGQPAGLRWSPPAQYTTTTELQSKGERRGRPRVTTGDQSWMTERLSEARGVEQTDRSASSDSVDTATESDTLLKGDDTTCYNSRLLTYFDTDNLDSLDSLQDTRV